MPFAVSRDLCAGNEWIVKKISRDYAKRKGCRA